MSWVAIIVFFLIMITVLVVVHEAGHFAAARAFHVRVTEFMIGLPGPNIGFTHNGTRFGITPILLGGYARICGMESGAEDPRLADALAFVNRQGSTDAIHLACALSVDEDTAENLLITLSGWGSITTPKGSLTGKTYLACPRDRYAKGEPREVDDPHALLDEERKGTYHALCAWKRIVCLIAGPLANLLLAIVIFIILYSAHGIYQVSTTLQAVTDGSPAAVAGLQAGDKITAIGDIETSDWDALSSCIASYSPGDTATVEYERDGSTGQTEVTFSQDESGGTILGIQVGYELVHLSVWESFKESFVYIGMVTQAVVGLLIPSQVAETISNSTSVIGIAYEAKSAASYGFATFVALQAALSVSLGILNLLPIPPLDGGKIVIEIGQRIARRELSMKVSGILSAIGISLFAVLFIVLLVQDVGTYVLGG